MNKKVTIKKVCKENIYKSRSLSNKKKDCEIEVPQSEITYLGVATWLCIRITHADV